MSHLGKDTIDQVKKAMKTIAHTKAQELRGKNRDLHMICVAVDQYNYTVAQFSGGIDKNPSTREKKVKTDMLKFHENTLNDAPWPKKYDWEKLDETDEGAVYSRCAEAHVWLELHARRKNPKNFVIFSFNNAGKIASPCVNCSQWVDEAFQFVFRETRTYEGHPKQKTTYRQRP